MTAFDLSCCCCCCCNHVRGSCLHGGRRTTNSNNNNNILQTHTHAHTHTHTTERTERLPDEVHDDDEARDRRTVVHKIGLDRIDRMVEGPRCLVDYIHGILFFLGLLLVLYRLMF